LGHIFGLGTLQIPSISDIASDLENLSGLFIMSYLSATLLHYQRQVNSLEYPLICSQIRRQVADFAIDVG
jgi:hypothetical protein